MRLILAIAITTFLIGSTYAYLKFSDSVRRTAVVYEVSYAEQEYAVEIRKSFTAVGDPIFGTESLKVLFKGEPIYARTDEVPADETIVIRPLAGVEVGENELYVSATRQPGGAALGVMELVVKRDNFQIATATIASVPGLDTISGTVVFDAARPDQPERHDHAP